MEVSRTINSDKRYYLDKKTIENAVDVYKRQGPNGSYELNFIRVNAQQRYYEKLKGVTEPEAKRKIIGEELDVYKRQVQRGCQEPYLL